MKSDFDEIIDRRNTNCLKYDFGLERKHREDLLPLWIADMDFRLPEIILNDIQKSVTHGIFGYSDSKEDYFLSLQNWFLTYFHWEVKRDWLIKTPGVVYAIAMAIKAFTKPQDAVIIQQPVYYPFSQCILDNGRRLINNQLCYQNGKYFIDFDDFEEKIQTEHVKLFILCSPHNPVGRVWTKEELNRIGEICLRHQVLVISDEIHSDFTYPGHPHTVFASMSETFSMNSIICTSPSKSFNMAGLQISNIYIPNEDLRTLFQQEINSSGYSQVNSLGLLACQSAYTNGGSWISDLKDYLKDNLDFVRDYLNKNIPQIKLVEPQGTYLIWLDCTGLGLSYKELELLITDKARLWLDGGIMFGRESALFERINIACPRSILKLALDQLSEAIKTSQISSI